MRPDAGLLERQRAVRSDDEAGFERRGIADATSDWASGTMSKDYPHHPKLAENLKKVTFEKLRDNGGAWVGSPERVRDTIAWYNDQVGGFEIASLQVNSHTTPVAAAEASMRLFAEKVMPDFIGAGTALDTTRAPGAALTAPAPTGDGADEASLIS